MIEFKGVKLDGPFLHYSRANEIVFKFSSSQFPGGSDKPGGLWVSVGTEWKDWCLDNTFDLEDLTYCFKIHLLPSRIKLLSGARDIDSFTEAYRAAHQPLEPMSNCRIHDIDWSKVAKDWGGIVIAPYCWERRLHPPTSWYYSWDVASGCIWDRNAILSIEPWNDGKPLETEAPEVIRRIQL